MKAKDGNGKASGTEKEGKDGPPAKDSTSDKAAPAARGQGEKKTVEKAVEADGNHAALDIAPLGKRQKKQRGEVKKEIEAAPEITTASAST